MCIQECKCSTGVEGLTGYELTVGVLPPHAYPNAIPLPAYPDACGDSSSITYQIPEVKHALNYILCNKLLVYDTINRMSPVMI